MIRRMEKGLYRTLLAVRRLLMLTRCNNVSDSSSGQVQIELDEHFWKDMITTFFTQVSPCQKLKMVNQTCSQNACRLLVVGRDCVFCGCMLTVFSFSCSCSCSLSLSLFLFLSVLSLWFLSVSICCLCLSLCSLSLSVFSLSLSVLSVSLCSLSVPLSLSPFHVFSSHSVSLSVCVFCFCGSNNFSTPSVTT